MKKKNIILISILSVLFTIIMCLVIFEKTAWFDNFVYQFIRMLRCDFFDNYFVTITKLGNILWILIVVFISILVFRNKHGILIGIGACDSVITNLFFKHLIKRKRPNGLRLIEQGGYSFPSGHAMISVCVYGYLLYLVITKIKSKWLKYILSIFLILLILSIGVSRIYVGVHYATDVIAGYILASIETILLIELSNMWYRGN